MTANSDGPNLESSREALIEFMTRLKEFHRGGRGSKKFNDVDRVACLADASHQLGTAKEGILAHPRCMEIPWMCQALQLMTLAGKMFLNIPPFPYTKRDLDYWIRADGFGIATKSLVPFWRTARPSFEAVLVHLQNNREARLLNPASVQPAIVASSAPTEQHPSQALAGSDGAVIDEADSQPLIPAERIERLEYEFRDEGLFLRVKHTNGCIEHTIPPFNDVMTKQASLVKLLIDGRGRATLSSIANALYAEEYKNGPSKSKNDLKNFPRVVRSLCKAINRRLGSKLLALQSTDVSGTVSLPPSIQILDLAECRENLESRRGTLGYQERGNM